jgi:hypothetical protein
MAKTKSKAKLRNADDQVGSHHDKHTADETAGPVKAAFKNHTWPASRKTLLAHARQHGMFSKSDLARLEKIPDRRYKSVIDVANAFKLADAEGGARPAHDEVGEVTTVQGNKMQGSAHIDDLDERRTKASRM